MFANPLKRESFRIGTMFLILAVNDRIGKMKITKLSTLKCCQSFQK